MLKAKLAKLRTQLLYFSFVFPIFDLFLNKKIKIKENPLQKEGKQEKVLRSPNMVMQEFR